MIRTTGKARTAIRYRSLGALVLLLAYTMSASPCHAQTGAKTAGAQTATISEIVPDQKLGPPSKKDPFPQGSFDQRVDVRFKTAVHNVADLDNATKWRVFVTFDDKSRTVLEGKNNGCATNPSAVTCWSVTKTDSDGNSTSTDELPEPKFQAASPALHISPFQALVILPSGTLTMHVTSLLIYFDNLPSPPWTIKGQGTCASMFCTATSKSTADNYFSGLYSPAIHSAAQYTIDFKASYVKQIPTFSPFYIGGIATVSTDQRPTADPDSFLVSGLLQWVIKSTPSSGASTVILNWEFAGLEFDRQTTTKTFISSPIVEIPLRVFGSAKSVASMGIFPYIGLETGSNLSNALRSEGSGFVFRGEVGSSVSLKFKPKLSYLSSIGITSTYTARIPAVSEIFTNTHYISATGKTVSLYSMSTQTRNHLKDELDITIAKPVSITIKHELGELPPGFRTIHNKVSLGLTVMLFQNNTASSSILGEQ
jgi:hypothetical protein